MVATATVPGRPPSPVHSIQESTATFGVHERAMEQSTVHFALDDPRPKHGTPLKGREHYDPSSSSVPEVNLNGSALPKSSTRVPKTSAPPAAGVVDSAWGANFWVTLIEPQVRPYLPFAMCDDHRCIAAGWLRMWKDLLC